MSEITEADAAILAGVELEEAYAGMFGAAPSRIRRLGLKDFEALETEAGGPWWEAHGVLLFEPTAARDTWLAATTGLSTPWPGAPAPVDPASGLGYELLVESRRPSEWAVETLARCLAYAVVIGAAAGGRRLEMGDTLSIADGPQGVAGLLCAAPHAFDPSVALASGQVEYVQLAPMSPADLRAARTLGTGDLARTLWERHRFLV